MLGKPFALWVSGCSGKVGGEAFQASNDGMPCGWQRGALTLPSWPVTASVSVMHCFCLSLELTKLIGMLLIMSLLPVFYCYLKMLTAYLGNEAWQTFRIGRVRFRAVSLWGLGAAVCTGSSHHGACGFGATLPPPFGLPRAGSQEHGCDGGLG